MDKRTTDIVCYITWIGLLIAFIFGDRENSKVHLNNALVIWLIGFLGFIPGLGVVIRIFTLICVIVGLIYAFKGEDKEVPLIGSLKIIK